MGNYGGILTRKPDGNMHKGKKAIIAYLDRNGYEATYYGTGKICVAGKVIKTMRDAIEFLIARNAFKKRRKA